MTNKQSFENVKNWLDELPNLTKNDTVVMIVGNKKDLIDANPSRRVVQEADIQNLAKSRRFNYRETSAFYQSQTIEETFNQLIIGKQTSNSPDSLAQEDKRAANQGQENSEVHSNRNHNVPSTAVQQIQGNKLTDGDPNKPKTDSKCGC